MTETIACARGCLRWGYHASDCEQSDPHTPGCIDEQCAGCNEQRCDGCQPREAAEGILCESCCRVLGSLLAGPDEVTNGQPVESIAYVTRWLAEQLRNPIRCNLGKSGRGGGEDDAFVRVFAALSDLQIAWAETAADFLGGVDARPVIDHDPAAISARLRPFARQLCAWGAIADTIDHLIELRDAAHAVAPWRGKNPDAADEVAAVLFLAPAETTQEICKRFGVNEQWVWQRRHRGLLAPEHDATNPLRWKPWDVYKLIEPAAAKRHEARLATLDDRIVYVTGQSAAWRHADAEG